MLSENLWFHNIYCFLYTGDTSISGCENGTGLLPESLNWMPYYIAGFSMVLVLINMFMAFGALYTYAERRLIARFILNRLSRIVSRTANQIDDAVIEVLDGPLKFFPVVITRI